MRLNGTLRNPFHSVIQPPCRRFSIGDLMVFSLGKRCLPPLLILVAGLTAHATPPPPPPSLHTQWVNTINAAGSELEVCKNHGGDQGLYGDVVVGYHARKARWRTSASKSLGKEANALKKCARTALKKHLRIFHIRDHERNETLTHTLVIGKPHSVLPSAPTLIPIWKNILLGRGKARANARRQMKKMLPPDYWLSKQNCLRTKRESIRNAQYLWLPSTGDPVPRMWHKLLGEALGHKIHVAMWQSSGFFVTVDERGLCLAKFGGAKQKTLRTRFDKSGACWAGSFEEILLLPRAEFPTSEKYSSVSTQNGRACAVTTSGAVTCCGPIDPPLPAAPGPLTEIALGYGFACGLDRQGAVSCWGDIAKPPTGAFTKISASHKHACALRTNGELACWGTGNYAVASAPKGKFVDVAVASFSSCGVRKSGAVECWGSDSRELHPPGSFSAVAANWTHACGVRKDGTIGCWNSKGGPVITPMSGTYKDVVAGNAHYVCGRRTDGTVRCWGSQPTLPTARVRPPPKARFASLSGDHDLFCGVRDDGHVECFGDVWPGTWLGDNTWKWPAVLGLTGQDPNPSKLSVGGRVVDGSGKPISNAEVLVCSDYGPCGSVVHLARTKSGSLAKLVSTLSANWEPDSFAHATTGADGRWSATLAVNPRRSQHTNDKIRAVVTARGREMIERSVHPIEAVAKLAVDMPVRRASAVDIKPMCGKVRCKGKTVTAITSHERYEGTYLQRLAPATYRIEVRVNPGEPGERVGKGIVNVTHAGGAQNVRIKMRRIGTGKSIRGTAELTLDGSKVKKVTVQARCDGSGSTIYRTTVADSSGKFHIADAGAPPCVVSLGSGMWMDASVSGTASVKIDRLPASKVKLQASVRRHPRRY